MRGPKEASQPGAEPFLRSSGVRRLLSVVALSSGCQGRRVLTSSLLLSDSANVFLHKCLKLTAMLPELS